MTTIYTHTLLQMLATVSGTFSPSRVRGTTKVLEAMHLRMVYIEAFMGRSVLSGILARRVASSGAGASYIFGAAIIYTKTGLIDFGRGFGVLVPHPEN